MKTTLTERVAVLETGFEILVKPMKKDLGEIKTSVQKMSHEMPELLRQTGESHEYIKKLKSAGCPTSHIIENNRKKNERKWDQKKYKTMIWIAIIGASGTILFIIGKLGSMLITAGQILESMPK